MTALHHETAHAGGCTKRTYPSRAKALLALDRIRIMHGQSIPQKTGKKRRKIERSRRAYPNGPRNVYACPFCGQWHLTSQEPKR